MTDEKNIPEQEPNQPNAQQQSPQPPNQQNTQQPPQQYQQAQQYQQGQQQPQQYQQGQPQQYQQAQQPQKKSKKGCLIGCLVVFLIFAISLSVIGFIISRNRGNIIKWGLERIFGDASPITDIFNGDDDGDSRTTTTTTAADSTTGRTTTEAAADAPPTTDARGDDVSEIIRYPGSVRTEASRLDFGSEVQHIQSFIAQADMTEIKDYYLQQLSAAGWMNVSQMTIDDYAIVTGEKEDGSMSIYITIEESRYDDHMQINIMLNQKKDDDNGERGGTGGDIDVAIPVYPGAEETNSYEVETGEMIHVQKQFIAEADLEEVKNFYLEWLEANSFRETMTWSTGQSATIGAERIEEDAKATVVITVQSINDDEVSIDFIYQVEF